MQIFTGSLLFSSGVSAICMIPMFVIILSHSTKCYIVTVFVRTVKKAFILPAYYLKSNDTVNFIRWNIDLAQKEKPVIIRYRGPTNDSNLQLFPLCIQSRQIFSERRGRRLHMLLKPIGHILKLPLTAGNSTGWFHWAWSFLYFSRFIFL